MPYSSKVQQRLRAKLPPEPLEHMERLGIADLCMPETDRSGGHAREPGIELKSGSNPNYPETVPFGSSSDLKRSSTLS